MSEANQGEMKGRFSELLQEAYSNQEFPSFVVTHNTEDYGDKYVVRLHRVTKEGVKPSEEHAVAISLDGARKNIPDGLYRAPRMPADAKVIVESWF